MTVLPNSIISDLKLVQQRFTLNWGQETTGQASGVIRAKDLRPALWAISLASGDLNHDAALDVEAQLATLSGSSFTFYAYDVRRPWPKADPKGVVLGASTVQINSVPDLTKLTLKGLPIGYVLSRGDYLAFDYGTGPSRALHQVTMAGATAGEDGVTGDVHVSPFLRIGAEEDLTVTLIKASGEFMVMPGTLDVQTAGLFTHINLDARQVLLSNA